MARTKKSAETVTVDVADLITEKLNELNGIEFARDAWQNEAPAQYGVTELAQEPNLIMADGKVIDEIYQMNVTLYVNGADDNWADAVREKTEELEAAYEWMDISFRMMQRIYLHDIGKVQWTFRLNFSGPLVRTLPA